jgi:hypothetical protein
MHLPPVPPQVQKSSIWDLEDDETEDQAINRDWNDTLQSIAECEQTINKYPSPP